MNIMTWQSIIWNMLGGGPCVWVIRTILKSYLDLSQDSLVFLVNSGQFWSNFAHAPPEPFPKQLESRSGANNCHDRLPKLRPRLVEILTQIVMLCCSQTISAIATSKHMIVELPQKILKPEPVNIAVYPRVNPMLKNLLLPETDMSDDRELSMPWTLAVRESPKQSGIRITCAVVTFLLRFLSLCPGKIAGPGN